MFPTVITLRNNNVVVEYDGNLAKPLDSFFIEDEPKNLQAAIKEKCSLLTIWSRNTNNIIFTNIITALIACYEENIKALGIFLFLKIFEKNK